MKYTRCAYAGLDFFTMKVNKLYEDNHMLVTLLQRKIQQALENYKCEKKANYNHTLFYSTYNNLSFFMV